MKVVLADACLWISFGKAERLDLIHDLNGIEVCTTPSVRREVRREPAASVLREAIDSGIVEVVGLDIEDRDQQTLLASYASEPAFRSGADAEVLALAAAHGWIIGSDDRSLRRAAIRDFGADRVAGTLDFLLWALRREVLTLREAERLLGALDVGPGILAQLERRGLELGDLL